MKTYTTGPLLAALFFCVASTVQAADGTFDTIARWIDGRLAEGSRVEVGEIIETLETTPLPPTKEREQLLTALVGALTARGEDSLADRLRAIPLADAPPAISTEPFTFPQAHGRHKRSVTEWWYFNGHLDSRHARFGYEVCFFKTVIGLDFLHVAITDETARTHTFERVYFRGSSTHADEGRGNVTFQENARVVDLGNNTFLLRARVGGYDLELHLASQREPLLINGNGIIDMPEGTTSRYYSFTRLKTTGTLTRKGASPVPVEGLSWFDHQWGNFIAFFRPWDWFCFQMDDGTDYNLFGFRKTWPFSERAHVNVLDSQGHTWVGKELQIARLTWWQSPKTEDYYVVKWRLRIPDRDETFTVSATIPAQEMPRTGWRDIAPAYWEGSVEAERRGPGGELTGGIGYSEHWPYGQPWEQSAPRRLPLRLN